MHGQQNVKICSVEFHIFPPTGTKNERDDVTRIEGKQYPDLSYYEVVACFRDKYKKITAIFLIHTAYHWRSVIYIT